MKRRSILSVGMDIFNLLLKESNQSAHAISRKVQCGRRTAIKILDFLKAISVIEEKKVYTGNKRYERRFSLK